MYVHIVYMVVHQFNVNVQHFPTDVLQCNKTLLIIGERVSDPSERLDSNMMTFHLDEVDRLYLSPGIGNITGSV